MNYPAKEPKGPLIPFVVLKRRGSADIEIITNADTKKQPSTVSKQVIERMRDTMPHNYDKNLFTITHYERGHFLIYDNQQIMGYTITRA